MKQTNSIKDGKLRLSMEFHYNEACIEDELKPALEALADVVDKSDLNHGRIGDEVKRFISQGIRMIRVVYNP